MTESSRSLTVAHQQPGECAYCDKRHDRIVAAVAHELAEKILAVPEDLETFEGMRRAADLIDPNGSPR